MVGSDPSTTVIESDFFFKLYRDFIKTCGGKSTNVFIILKINYFLVIIAVTNSGNVLKKRLFQGCSFISFLVLFYFLTR